MNKKYLSACESCGNYLNEDNPRSKSCDDADICKKCLTELNNELSEETPKTTNSTVKAGDWIRFYCGGQLVIVEYVQARDKYPYTIEYMTDILQYMTDKGVTYSYFECRAKP